MKQVLILACLLITGTAYGQRPSDKIRVRVDYLLENGDSTEVWLRRQHPYRRTKVSYFAAMLPNPIPDSLKVGNYVTLYLGRKRNGAAADPCSIPFRLVEK